MREHLIHFLLVPMLMVGSVTAAFAQSTVKGQVVDTESGEPLIGAAVTVDGTSQGSVTDVNGYFVQKVGENATLVFKYLGYKEVTKKITQKGTVNLGVIRMEPDAVMLKDVTITSSVAVARKTPIAVSTIEPTFIEEKLGNQEFTEILKSTPSVFTSKEGGGYGDSEVTVRGFGSANTAVMINGVPMNDMEWGGIYWSNWAGLSDVSRSIQVQRGIRASKLSSPSVGGSINVLTSALETKAGGALSYNMGNSGENKILFSVSSGMSKKGWAFTVLGSKKWGDGYIYGTQGESYSWYVNIAKRIGENHSLSLVATGAPQSHYKRYDKLTIVEWQKQKDVGIGAGYRYNATYGFDDQGREYHGTNYNFYHKPQISLNHIWAIDYKSSLSSSLYLSIGSGYGYRGVSSGYSALYGASNDKLSAVVSGNANIATNQRYGHFYVNDEKSGVERKVGFGVKGGANYNITEHHNVFANVGYFSRTPFFSGGIFLNSQSSNVVNPDSRNEKVLSYELGYGYVSSMLNVKLNFYRTEWNDRSIQKTLTSAQESPYLILNGVNALHQGVELEFTYRPIHDVTVTGMFSLGDWTWAKDGATGRVYDRNGQALDYNNNVVPVGSPEHATYSMNMKDIKVANSAQTTAALGVSYQVMKGLKIGMSGNFNGRNYADYDIASQATKATKDNPVVQLVQPWRLPSSYVFDANISYKFKIANLDASWTANCFNLFNENYVMRALDNGARTGGHGWEDAAVFYGFGRTWSTGLKVRF